MTTTTQEFRRAPELFIDEAVSFDVFDPIDAQLIGYQAAAMTDRLPTAAHQERLVVGVQQVDESSARSLVMIHRGMVAAVAYGFKGQGVESRDLMVTGMKALISAADSYEDDEISGFNDHAVVRVEAALARAVPGSRRVLTDRSRGRPMDQIFQRMAALQPAAEREARNREVLEGFSPLEQKVLRLLILPTHRQIADRIGPSTDVAAIKNAKKRCYDKTDTNTTTSLILELHARGLHYDIPAPESPLVEILTDEELDMGHLLDLEYEELGHQFGSINPKQVGGKVDRMQTKTGTRSRHELALLINIYDTGERQNPDSVLARNLRELSARLGAASLQKSEVELLLEEVTVLQRQAVAAKWLSGDDVTWNEVGDQLDEAAHVVRLRGNAGIRAMRKLYSASVI